MRISQSLRSLLRAACVAVGLAAASGSAFAFSMPAVVVLDNEDDGSTVSGTTTSVAWLNGTVNNNLVAPPVGETARRMASVTGTATAYVQYDFITLYGGTPSLGGSHTLRAFVPNDDTAPNAVDAEYQVWLAPATFALFTGWSCGTYVLEATYSFSQAVHEGRWGIVGTFATSDGSKCVRVRVTNRAATTTAGTVIWADALELSRTYEVSANIVDSPRVANAFAAATNYIPSSSNATPTIIVTNSFTCPKVGRVVVTASGESAAQSGAAGTNFIGLAYSISKNSTATDNSNVVQSSALATFNGDANRDFLNLQRYDTCTAGEAITYRLTAYRTTAQTAGTASSGSFIWNPRLVVMYFPDL